MRRLLKLLETPTGGPRCACRRRNCESHNRTHITAPAVFFVSLIIWRCKFQSPYSFPPGLFSVYIPIHGTITCPRKEKACTRPNRRPFPGPFAHILLVRSQDARADSDEHSGTNEMNESAGTEAMEVNPSAEHPASNESKPPQSCVRRFWEREEKDGMPDV